LSSPELLEDAEHNRADESKCDIRGDDAQPVDEGHGNSPSLTSLPASAQQISRATMGEKVSRTVNALQQAGIRG
jgi:hypothetical protein